MITINHSVFIVLVVLFVIQCELSKVSPKLDFESTDNVTPTTVEGSPKIHGVRVIVDTSSPKKSVESRSSEELPHMPNKNGNKIVGIRTDITFEINDDNNSTAMTKKSKDAETIQDDDDIIPVFKGYGNVHEQKSYGNDRRWDMVNIPVFHGTDDTPHRNGGGGDWVRFVPITSVWTTERNNYLSNRDYHRRFDNGGSNQKSSWKPCLCNHDSVGFKGTPNSGRSLYPTTKRVKIDDKLDRTFPDEDKSKK